MGNILITTMGMATRTLGGPSKFAPNLFEKLSKTNDCIFGYFDFKLYKKGDSLEYYNNISSEDKKLWDLNTLIIKLRYFVSYFDFFTLARKKSDLKRVKEMYEIIVKNNITLVHSHDFHSAYLFSKVKRLYDIDFKIILTNHFKGSLYMEYTKDLSERNKLRYFKLYFERIEIEAIKYADVITFPSKGAMKLLIHDYPCLKETIELKTKIIYTGITGVEKIEKNSISNEIILLSVANHISAKGLEYTLQLVNKIYSEVAKLNLTMKFINCGCEGPVTEAIQKYVVDHNLSDVVEFKGLVDNKAIAKLLNESDVFILTPNITVFDLSLLEAMSVGLPIFTCPLDGNIEMLGDDYELFSKQDIGEDSKLIINFINNKKVKDDCTDYLTNRFSILFQEKKMLENYNAIYSS